MAGIEPATSAWKAEVLPLNYIRGIVYKSNYYKTNFAFAVIQYSSNCTNVKDFLANFVIDLTKTRNSPDPFRCDLGLLAL